MGKESAKVGQGKAFKEGWIKKYKDKLRANVRIVFVAIQAYALTHEYRQIRLSIQVESNSKSYKRRAHIQTQK